ncbi:hypothetical protein AVEN_51001-1 [Araneus ventricosus]|uniref:Uncharacterized protein n=1 Tax=Araneus ventricosus TaxID=182803 RepID=A0A4Y2N802_ARAVE|nr:hypothetical protein AVEN_51001-1 [Araneus ventricosus]
MRHDVSGLTHRGAAHEEDDVVSCASDHHENKQRKTMWRSWWLLTHHKITPPPPSATAATTSAGGAGQRPLEDIGSLQALRLEESARQGQERRGLLRPLRQRSGQKSSNELPLESDLKPVSTDFCVSTRKFAAGIAVAGILLMLAVMFLVICVLHKRRRRKGASSASSIYSGPYSNHAYSRD